MTDEKPNPKQESGSQQPKQPQSSNQPDQKPGRAAQQQDTEHEPKNKEPQKSERGSSDGGSQNRDREQLNPSKDRKAS
jgi:hypothetical protein